MLRITVLLFIACIAASCQETARSKRQTSVQKAGTAAVADTAADTMYQAFLQDKYFFSTIISLADEDSAAFIFTDSSYFGKDYLANTDRYNYYRQVRRLIPKEELEAHRIAWRIPELRKAQNGKGGYGTLVTWITGRPADASGYYELSVKTNDVDHLGTFSDMPYIRVWPHTGKIEIETTEDGTMSLKEWRRKQKESSYE